MDNYPQYSVVFPFQLSNQRRYIDDEINHQQAVYIPARKNGVLLPDQIHQWGDLIHTKLGTDTVTYNFYKLVPFFALPDSRSYFDNQLLVPTLHLLYATAGCNVGGNITHLEPVWLCSQAPH